MYQPTTQIGSYPTQFQQLPMPLFPFETPMQPSSYVISSMGTVSWLGIPYCPEVFPPSYFARPPLPPPTPQIFTPQSVTTTTDDMPYVSSVLNSKILESMKPTPDFAYYVPPRVEDTDYFGGQIRIWQDKMVPTFKLFQPHIWNLYGLPLITTSIEQDWYFFTITCKLRFCCRKCFRPWTSMRGKIHFSFKLDEVSSRGTIVMKIFGQVCNREGCDDPNFQTPACYPEEIHRVLIKLSEYIGYVLYFYPLPATFYIEPDKAIRIGNPRSPHRPSLCQACQQGICSKRTINLRSLDLRITNPNPVSSFFIYPETLLL